MLRSVYVTALVVGLALAGLSTPSFAERVRGTVLERTRHSLTVLTSEGRTRSFERARDLRVQGEADRWRDIRRGDSVKVRFEREGRHRYADRVAVASTRLYKSHPRQRYVTGEITHVGRRGFVMLTNSGKRVKVRTTGDTLLFTHGRRALRDCDRVQVILDRRNKRGVNRALQVRRIDSRPERYAQLDLSDVRDSNDRRDATNLRNDDRPDDDRRGDNRRGDNRRR